MDGIHDPALRTLCLHHGPWEVRVAGSRCAPSLQLVWGDLDFSLLLPSACTDQHYDVRCGGMRLRCATWSNLVRTLGPIGESLPSLARIRAWTRWHSARVDPLPHQRQRRSAPVVPLRAERG
ncbi:MAG: hypothetical protein CMN30_31165 [Sandaracinus sp.]|nr:hypothetical protein [Sandaracinus sp.]